MKLIKVVDTKREWKDKKGKIHKTSCMYYVVLDNLNRIAIRPVFLDDFDKLDICSEVLYKGEK